MTKHMLKIGMLAVAASLFMPIANAGRVTDCTEQCTNDYVACLSGASGYWEEVWCYAAYEGDMIFCLALGPDE